MTTTYIFLDNITGNTIAKQGFNEMVARYAGQVIPSHMVLYQVIFECDSYKRTVTYDTSIYSKIPVALSIEHINK